MPDCTHAQTPGNPPCITVGLAYTALVQPKSKAFWPKDFLPLQIPDARIMTFGYSANAKSLLASLADKARSQRYKAEVNIRQRRY
jgi:hypothetical protein